MYRIRLVAHRLGGTPPIPAGPLNALYGPCGVQFEVVEGEPLASDPLYWQSYLDLLHRYDHPAPPAGAPAHVFVGGEWRNVGLNGTNGILLNRERGAVAVFSRSYELRGGNPAAFLQTCAHELAHLLNLTHSEGDEEAPTIECPSRIRYGHPVAEAWARAGQPRPAGVDCFPLSAASRRILTTSSAETILPWGRPFADTGAGAVDRGPGLPALRGDA